MDAMFWVGYVSLWLLVLVLFGGVFVLYRHLGQQLLNTHERRMAQGPELGTRLPAVKLRTLSGATFDLSRPRELPLLLFVGSTTCKPCAESLPALGRFAQRYAGRIDTLLVCRGATQDDVASFVEGLPAALETVAERGWDLGGALRVSSTPFALIADLNLIVRARGTPSSQDEALEWYREQLEIATGELGPTIESVRADLQSA